MTTSRPWQTSASSVSKALGVTGMGWFSQEQGLACPDPCRDRPEFVDNPGLRSHRLKTRGVKSRPAGKLRRR